AGPLESPAAVTLPSAVAWAAACERPAIHGPSVLGGGSARPEPYGPRGRSAGRVPQGTARRRRGSHRAAIRPTPGTFWNVTADSPGGSSMHALCTDMWSCTATVGLAGCGPRTP